MAAHSKSHRLIGTDSADRIQGTGGDDAIYGTHAVDKSATAGQIRVEVVGTGFKGAVTALSAPNDPDHLYVIEKDPGKIWRLDPHTGEASLFLDIPDDQFASDGEQGVLSLAFHPHYADNGLFFVSLTTPAGDVQLRQYRASPAGTSFAQEILTVPHPGHDNHNGGTVLFSPNDGYLYWSIGDGGSDNDPPNNARNLNVLLGKIRRLDIDHDAFPGNSARNYAVPHDNPFVGKAGADEIWDYGLRNPWRIAFDKTGDLYIGDVGQDTREEIDFEAAGSGGGRNYGWRKMEGTFGTKEPGMVRPIFDYGHDVGNVVTGGEVYRGPGHAFQGSYFFADFGSGRMWTLKVSHGEAKHVADRTDQIVSLDQPVQLISSFGHDGHGNLYAVSLNGTIFHLDPTRLSDDVGDRLFGRSGDDLVYGGPGKDRLFGGSGHDKLFGGFGNDLLKGDGGKDVLAGGAGNDTLKGGDGKDVFAFAAPLSQSANVDTLKDFAAGSDRVRLDHKVFVGLVHGFLPQEAFFSGPSAHDGSDRILYDSRTGSLSFDADGTGPADAVTFAQLPSHSALSHSDLLVA